MLRTTILLIVFIYHIPAVHAQITVQAADFQGQTGAHFYELLGDNQNHPLPADLSILPAIMTLDGQNTTFDFATIVAQLDTFSFNEYINLPADSLNLPGYESHFLVATDAWKVSIPDVPDAYLYRKITTDSLSHIGSGIWTDTNGDGVEDQAVNRFSPRKLQAPLPMSLGQAWTSNFTHIGIVNSPIGVIEVPGIQEMHDIKIDGYGTLVLPGGAYPCLRVRINQTIVNPVIGTQELGGWSYVTTELVQVGVFYNQHIPDDPSTINFDLQSPHSISVFIPADAEMPTATEPAPRAQPANFALEANYPNPFNPSTSVPFTLSTAAQVQLDIFNAQGQFVTRLANAFKTTGSYTYDWQAEGQPSGVYFARLTVDGVSSQRPMLLLK